MKIRGGIGNVRSLRNPESLVTRSINNSFSRSRLSRPEYLSVQSTMYTCISVDETKKYIRIGQDQRARFVMKISFELKIRPESPGSRENFKRHEKFIA